MKKLFAILFVAFVGVATIVPEHNAEAQQVPLTVKCCDGYGYVRCQLVNWTPVGNSCFCPNQGWGVACL